MGKEELKKALVQEAEERMRNLWSAAEREIADLRDQVARKQEADEQRAEQRLQEELAEIQAASRQDIQDIERRSRLEAEHCLAERMHALARELLPELTAADRERWFQLLAEEIPEGEWREVRIYPEDKPHAEKRFPDARLVEDPDQAGGLVAVNETGRIRVDNSLTKRLERIWPELLPELIKTVRKEVSQHELAPASTDS